MFVSDGFFSERRPFVPKLRHSCLRRALLASLKLGLRRRSAPTLPASRLCSVSGNMVLFDRFPSSRHADRTYERFTRERLPVMRSKPSPRFLLTVGLAVGAVSVTGCWGTKDQATSSFDMAEYRKMVGEQKKQQERLEEATSAAPELTAEEHERKGDLDAQARHYPLASMHYDKALKADPARNAARLKLGQVFLQQGLLDQALMHFQDLRTREPQSAPVHEGLGQIYLMQGEAEEAETALTKAITLSPSSWQAHNLLGLLYDQQKRHAEAIVAYHTALTYRPREPHVLNNLGLAYALSGNYDAAIDAYEQAVAAGSNSPKLYNNLGIAYVQRRRYTDALNTFKKGMDEPRAYNNLGVALLGANSPKKAVLCFEKAIELNPQYYEKASENLHMARQAVPNTATGTTATGIVETGSCP
jgi:Flp pilus assembly protein TadD